MKNFFAGITPKLFQTVRGYSKQQLLRDVIAGVIVAIIALPLSIALAIASGVSPEQGLYTAIFAGFCISFFGGSRVQIGGPTAAFVVLVYGIVQQHGVQGLILATLMAGVMLLVMGLCRLGSLIRYMPHAITVGFTCGIGVTLLIGQLKDFLGMQIASVPSETMEKLAVYAEHIGTVNWWALAVGAGTVAILVLLPKVLPRVPASLIGIVAATLVVKLCGLPVDTIGSIFGQLSSSIPSPSLPAMDIELIKQLIQPAFTIALLAAIESLLSCVVADEMIGDKHNPNAELMAQGIGNLLSGLFGGIPATGAIARTAANVKNGGRTPVAGVVHAITLLLILLLMMPLASMIPMTALAAVLIVVACNMCDVKGFVGLMRTAPKTDALVLVVTFVLTVVFDLVVAIAVGVAVSLLFFVIGKIRARA